MDEAKENIKAIKGIMEDQGSLIGKGYNVLRKYSADNVRQKLMDYYKGIIDGS